MKRQQAFEAVGKLGWLSRQPAEFRTRLLAEANVREYEAGQILFEAGDPVHSLIGLASGTLDILLEHPQLQTQLLHIAQPGIWLGEQSAYGKHRTRSVSAHANTDCLIVVVPRPRIDAIVKEEPLFLRCFGDLSDLHVRECMGAIVELSQRDLFLKVCTRLISLGIAYVRGGEHGTIEIPVTQDQFAALCGLSRKTLGRVLTELKQLKVIDVQYRSMTILDLKKLSAVAAGELPAGVAAYQAAAS